MPMPWSPSPAIASMRPSSSALRSTVSRTAATTSASVGGRRGTRRSRRARPRRRRPSRGRVGVGDGGDRAAAEGRGVGGGAPEPLELLVDPEQGEGGAGHVEARAELADLRVDGLDARLLQQLGDAAEDDEQLLVLHGAEAVEDRDDAGALRGGDALGELLEQSADEELGEAGRGRDIRLADAGLAVDAEADGHAALGNGEQRLLGSGQRAAGEGDAERAGALVREPRDAHDAVEVVALRGRGAATLKTVRSPAMPRRLCFSATGALDTSSVTVTVSHGMPSARSCSCAASKLSTSPA